MLERFPDETWQVSLLALMKFFNPYDEIRVTRHHLPHWQQVGAAYFITFRLADSLPAYLVKSWKAERQAWLEAHPSPLSDEDDKEYHRRFSSQIDKWLDANHGSCVLRSQAFRDVVADSLAYSEGQRYELLSWIIMPNHIHIGCVLHPDWLLEKVVFTWKRRTAGTINEMRGAQGQFWQHDYFDRLIRDGQHLRNVIRYIRRNPVKARLRETEFTLWESELAKAVE